MKKCGKCSNLKSKSDFRKDKNRLDGLDARCRACRSVSEKERYWINPDKKKDYRKSKYLTGKIKYNPVSYLQQKANGKKKARDLNRRSLKNKAEGKITSQIIRELLNESNGVCFYCKKECFLKYHIDHFIPLSKGGNNLKENLRISCPKCNLKKGNKIVQ